MKRGFLLSQVALLLLIGASILVLVFWLSSTARSGSNAVGEQGCRRSINIYSTLSKATEISSAIKSSARDPPIECEPREVTISTKNKEEALIKIAKELEFCWDRWQQGDVELPGKGPYCSPCSIITFTGGKEIASSIDEANEDLINYFIAKNPSFLESLFSQFNETYLQYLLSNIHTPQEVILFIVDPEGGLTTFLKQAPGAFPQQTEYTLFFTYHKTAFKDSYSPVPNAHSEYLFKHVFLIPKNESAYFVPLPLRSHSEYNINWAGVRCEKILSKGAPRQSEGAENI